MEYIVLLSHMAYKLTQIYIIFNSNIKSSHLGIYASVITCWLSTYVPNPVLGTGGTTVSKTHKCLPQGTYRIREEMTNSTTG